MAFRASSAPSASSRTLAPLKVAIVREVASYRIPRAPLAAGLLLVALGLAVAALPVHERGPVTCPFRAATGLPCPTCGLLRSAHHLLEGRIDDAFATNPLAAFAMLVVAPVVLVAWLLNATGRWAVRVSLTPRERRAAWCSLGALAILNWVYVLATQR